MKLNGITCLDLSLFLPGPTVSQMMSDHGARVIKIESLGEKANPTGTSVSVGTVTRPCISPARIEARKVSTLNLKSAEGLEVFMKLAASGQM